MRLLLTVLSAQRGTLGELSTHAFDRTGGTIGRSAGCNWSLPDGSNTLSARHASIAHNGHGFLITDTSTNGVYLNAVDAPLGRGQSGALSNGDTLYIADYIISVSMLKEMAQPAASLYAASPAAPFPLPHALPPMPMPAFGSGLPENVQEPARSDRFALSMGDLLSGPAPAAAMPALPPMPPAQAPLPIPPAFAVPAAAAPAFPIAPPAPAPTPGRPATVIPTAVIPDDFDFSDLAPPAAAAPPPSAMQPSAVAPMSPVPAPTTLPVLPMPASEPAPPAALDPLAMLRQRAIARAASIDLSPQAADGPQPGAVPVSATVRVPRPAIADVAMPGGLAAEGSSDAGAFWQALGLDPEAIPAASRQDMLAELGSAMRETAAGLVMVLSARKSMKDEFRVDQTRLAPRENNPFKFFRSGDEALQRVIAEAKPGYLALDRAVAQGFADIQAHEVATAIAMQNSLRNLLDRMAPAAVEQGAEPGMLGRRPDKSRLWERYVEMHAALTGDLDATTRDMLSEEFARAYAGQTRDAAVETGR